MFVLRRTLESLLALWLASVIVFAGARSLPGDPAGPLTGVVFTFEDGRRVDVYDAGRCLHMVVLPEAPAPAGART